MAVVYLAECRGRTRTNSAAPKANERRAGDTGRVPGNRAGLAAAGKLPRVAIKIMSCHAGNPWKSFRKEQNILSTVSHPNIAELYDYGITREGLLYIAMEYIDGVAVDRFCDMQGLGTGDRLRLLMQVCDAIQYTHGKQIIHHDIKPSNILVDRTGKVKVIDFGVAAILNDPGNRSLSGSGFSGTLSYAAPERLEGVAPSFSSDIYQIGMVMHKLITGNLPRTCFDPAAVQGSLPGRGDLPRKVRKEMVRIFTRSLSPDPADRYQRAETLGKDIRNLLASIDSIIKNPGNLAAPGNPV
jgi:eukaryotic-like serine/threonine-protein kinase